MASLALIPARCGSKGIPQKNFRELAPGVTPLGLAVDVASRAGVDRIVVTTDHPEWNDARAIVVRRPPELGDEQAPMIEVLIHALHMVSGSPDEQIILLQPTQPLRTVQHIHRALNQHRALSPGTSLLTVVEVPPEYRKTFEVVGGYARLPVEWYRHGTGTPRQQAQARYLADGTAYVTSRTMIEDRHTIFSSRCYAQIMNPAETCPLDTMNDWVAAVERFNDNEQARTLKEE